MTTAAGPERLHGLDAVRGYALLLGVVFHATMAYLPGPPVWVVTDEARSAGLSVVFFTAHMFRMTTFFLIAGFFAHMAFHRRGAGAFIRDRLLRIGVPLLVGWPILITAIVVASAYGLYVKTGVWPTRPPPTPSAGPPPAFFFPLTHLWFLYVLLGLYAGSLALRAVVAALDPAGRLRGGVDRAFAVVAGSPLAPLALAVPVATALALFPGWLAWFGVPTPDMSLIPNPPAAVGFGAAFGFGWLLHRQPALLESWTRRWPLNLTLALAVTAGLLVRMGLTPVTTPAPAGPEKLALAAAYALGTWSWTLGVIGLAMRFLADHSAARRYIADSSYWIYLIHLPIVIFLQAWVTPFGWPAPVKLAVVLGIGFGLMFATYELLVRHTFVGRVLNGRRVPWRAPTQLETAR